MFGALFKTAIVVSIRGHQICVCGDKICALCCRKRGLCSAKNVVRATLSESVVAVVVTSNDWNGTDNGSHHVTPRNVECTCENTHTVSDNGGAGVEGVHSSANAAFPPVTRFN